MDFQSKDERMMLLLPETNLLHIPGYKTRQSAQFISRLEGERNYTRLYLTTDRKPLLSCQSLTYFERMLPDFIRIHKSVLINADFVCQVVEKGCRQLQLVLVDGTICTVSRRRIPTTRARLFHYHRDNEKRSWIFNQPPRPVHQI